jgi:hypothetical protein
MTDLDNPRPRLTGALIIASIGIALLFLSWIAIYFLLFLPRGAVG